MSVFEKAIGWLAPAQCVSCSREGSAICNECAGHITRFGERCWRCNTLSPGSRTCDTCRRTGSPLYIYIATDYQGQARSLLSTYKFGHLRAAANPIAKIMVEALTEYQDILLDYLVVPVPTATKRIRERGFGHSELLARQVAINLKFEYANILRRLGQSRQLGSRREVRLTQLTNSFASKNDRSISGQNILLVDDVLTTGGTVLSAAKVLKASGAKRVDALLFAKRL